MPDRANWYEMLFNTMLEGVVICNAESRVILSNPAAVDLIGWGPDGCIALTSPGWTLYHEDGSLMPVDDIPSRVVLRTGQPLHGYVMGIQRPDGRLIWIRTNGAPIWHEGELIGCLVVFDDVTQHRLLMERIKENEARYEGVLSVIGQALQQARVPRTEPDVVLTRREVEVLRLVAQGYTNGQIAKNLAISEKTVSSRLTAIYDKLQFRNRVQVALYALRHGYAKIDEKLIHRHSDPHQLDGQ